MEINHEKAKLSNSLTAASNTQHEATTKQPLPDSWVSALFAKLQARYGYRWSSAYPGEVLPGALAEWAEGLSGVTGEQIKAGLAALDSPWPPSLPEFREICAGSRGRINNAAYRLTAPQRVIKQKPIWPDTLGGYLRELRQEESQGK